MKPLFNVPGEGSFALLMGTISGYPMGAKIVADFKERQTLTKIEAERLLSFTNNSGPLFIVRNSAARGFFHNARIGILLLFTHILASITVRLHIQMVEKRQKIYTRRTYGLKPIQSITKSGSYINKSIQLRRNTI